MHCSMKNDKDAYDVHVAISVITIITYYVQLSVLIVAIMITIIIRSNSIIIIVIRTGLRSFSRGLHLKTVIRL